MGASSGGTIAGVPSSQLLVVNGGGTGVAAMDSSGDIGASGYFSSINGLKLGNGFPPSGPDVHSDGSNLILEANTAGNSIFLRPQGLGQTTGQAQYSIANGLTIAPTINAVNTSANVAPVYTSAGANIGSTLHTVVGQAGFTLSSSCAAGAICSLASGNPIALTGAAVFNNSAYCSANANYGTNALAIQVGVSGTNSLNFQLVNPSSGALSTGPTYYVNYVCIGT